jgi:hypothetical protein
MGSEKETPQPQPVDENPKPPPEPIKPAEPTHRESTDQTPKTRT